METMTGKKIVGFVPARAGSTRVKGKNVQKILGVPLFLWAANNLSRVIGKENVYIDTNCDEVKRYATKHGFNIIHRPEDLATNATSGNDFMIWEASNVEADIYIQHLPPMPFLRKSTLKECIDSVIDGKDSSFVVLRENLYTWNSDYTSNYDYKKLPNSVDLDETIIEGMGLYVTTKESLFGYKSRIGDDFEMVEINKFEAIDIDYPEDLEFARAVATGLGYDSEYTEGIEKYVEEDE